MRTILVTCLAASLLPLLLAGCGQAGPLYLPVTPPRTILAMPGATTHAPAATTTKPPASATPAAHSLTHTLPANTKPGT